MDGKNKKEHAKMPPSQRAKQFLPFDAVAGLREALKAKELEHEKNMQQKPGEPEDTEVYYDEDQEELLKL